MRTLIDLAIAATAVAAVLIVGHRWKEQIMGAEQDAVDQVTAQLGKASAEILAKIGELEAAVANGEVPDFAALKAAAQSLDDIVPDPEPTPE